MVLELTGHNLIMSKVVIIWFPSCVPAHQCITAPQQRVCPFVNVSTDAALLGIVTAALYCYLDIQNLIQCAKMPERNQIVSTLAL